MISAPSGTGKTTVCRNVVKKLPSLELSVSYTTRQKKAGEREGVDYHFVDARKFDAMIDEGAFIEWAEIYGNKYGTAKKTVDRALGEGKDLLLEIDVQGGVKVKEIMDEAVLIALFPPGVESLYGRLKRRQRENEEEIQERISEARRELDILQCYDYFVINSRLEKAIEDVVMIVNAQSHRIDRNRIFIQNIISQFRR